MAQTNTSVKEEKPIRGASSGTLNRGRMLRLKVAEILRIVAHSLQRHLLRRKVKKDSCSFYAHKNFTKIWGKFVVLGVQKYKSEIMSHNNAFIQEKLASQDHRCRLLQCGWCPLELGTLADLRGFAQFFKQLVANVKLRMCTETVRILASLDIKLLW